MPIVAAHAPEYMTEGLDETEAGTVDASAVDRVLAVDADVIAVGPGLRRGPDVTRFVRALVDRSEAPLVLDADALNAFADEPATLVAREGREIIITPHPGEMARLVGGTVDDVQANRLGLARDFASRHRLYLILKGHRTLIATPDGKVFVNPTGSPGMATGGTGDVLSGMVAAWLAQLLDAEAACRLAVYLHGAAGELADADEGEVSMTAVDPRSTSATRSSSSPPVAACLRRSRSEGRKRSSVPGTDARFPCRQHHLAGSAERDIFRAGTGEQPGRWLEDVQAIMSGVRERHARGSRASWRRTSSLDRLFFLRRSRSGEGGLRPRSGGGLSVVIRTRGHEPDVHAGARIPWWPLAARARRSLSSGPGRSRRD